MIILNNVLGYKMTSDYHAIRASLLEVEFIDVTQAGDVLINRAQKDAVKASVTAVIKEAIITNLNEFGAP